MTAPNPCPECPRLSAKLRAITSELAVIEFDVEGTIIDVNETYLRLFR